MKLKYYLRGLGIGIIITTIVLMIANAGHRKELTDAEIIKRAEALGMVMEQKPLLPGSKQNEDTEEEQETAVSENSEWMTETESEMLTDSEGIVETEQVSEFEVETETQSEQPIEVEVETEGQSEQVSEIETETDAENESEMLTDGETYHLVILSGEMPRVICTKLEENGVVESASALRQYLDEVGFVKYIKPGEYDIPYGSTNEEVYQILKEGPQ